MQTYTFVEISSTLQCHIILRGIRVGLESHFFPNWRQQNLLINYLKLRNFFEVFGKSHGAEKCETEDPLQFFEHLFYCKYQRLEGGPFEDIK